MIKRVLLFFVMVAFAITLQSNEIGITTLRNNAMKGLNVESGYEQEMAAWAYYRINGADGIAKDYNEAVKILKKLVARNKNKVDSDKFTYVVEGYNMLGNCYEKSYGVQKDIDKARKYWQQAANYNHADAQAKIEKYVKISTIENFTTIVTGLMFSALNKKGKNEKKIEKAKQLKVTFTIPQNNSTPVGVKNIYLRITSPEGVLLGNAGSFPLDGSSVQCTAKKQIEYGGEEIGGIVIYWDVNTTLTKGEYLVELFTDGYRLASRRFTMDK